MMQSNPAAGTVVHQSGTSQGGQGLTVPLSEEPVGLVGRHCASGTTCDGAISLQVLRICSNCNFHALTFEYKVLKKAPVKYISKVCLCAVEDLL